MVAQAGFWLEWGQFRRKMSCDLIQPTHPEIDAPPFVTFEGWEFVPPILMGIVFRPLDAEPALPHQL